MRDASSGTRRRITLAAAAAMVLALASVAAAQFGNQGFGPRSYPAKFATPDTFGHGFNFCRGIYTSGRREAGGQGWSTDYPDAELNFSIRLSELTKARVPRDWYGQPEHIVVRLTDPELFQCPYLHLEDVGTASMTEEEIAGLREYMLKGGFVWCDDFWGSYAWNAWVSQMARVLSPTEFPIQDIPLSHPIFKTMFEVKKVTQVPSIQYWRTSNGDTSERGGDSSTPAVRGIFDHHGNLMMLMTHNTDMSDSWEREGEDPRFFYSFSPDGYAFGINVILYAFTHYTALLAVLVTATAAYAQLGQFGLRGFGLPDRTTVEYTSQFAFTRIRYNSDRARGIFRGGGWEHDYPTADRNLSAIVDYISHARVHLDGGNILDLDDDAIFENPVIYMSEPGFWQTTDREAEYLRKYLLKGGLIIFDDFDGAGEWQNLVRQVHAALPELDFIRLDVTHPLFHSFFDIKTLEVPHPMLSGIPPEFYGLFENNDPRGRLLAIADYNNDLGDYWEWSAEGLYGADPTNDAYRLGVNYILYALTH